MSWLEATARPAASRPEIDQPAAPVPGDRTGSLNTTRMVSSETAVALRTDGGTESTRGSGEAASRGFRAASRTASTSISSMPVAPRSAAAPPNASVWSSVPFPSRPVTGRGSPPEDRATDAYAPGPAQTSSV